MSGFSPEWLALRESVDHRSRDTALAADLKAAFAGRASATIFDLGCGTGSNLRGTFKFLPDEQQWTLVDYDARLLAAARQSLTQWAGATHRHEGDTLVLTQAGKRLRISFRQADLNAGLDCALGPTPDLVTASAFFDLCSERFISRLAAAVAARRAVFFTVLTYNGEQTWTPPHPADDMMRQSFCAHQLTDKGFGASSGPSAPGALTRSFRAAGYRVSDGDSPWRLGPPDSRLITDLAVGFAAAVAETGDVHADVIASWSAVARTHAIVGHTDILALPAL